MSTDRRFRLARIWSNRELQRVASSMRGSVVNVSGWKDDDKEGGRYRQYFTNSSEYRVTNFKGERGFQGSENEIELDLTQPLREELRGTFDVVYNHTTLEHIYDVQTAFKNLCEMSRDLVIVVVPFAQVQHECEAFLDFWRFTPTCLRYMFADNNMTVIYESANKDHNAATYVFMIASKSPDTWKDILPRYSPLSGIASGIGMRWFERLKESIRETF